MVFNMFFERSDKTMNTEIKVNLKSIIGEFLGLAKPGASCDTKIKDINSLECYGKFNDLCLKDTEHDNRDMAAAAALLFEMQIKNNVPDEYTENSKKFADMVKRNRKMDVSENRDYVFFAYEIMRELEKLSDAAECIVSGDTAGIYAMASQDDDISCIAVVNNSDKEVFADIDISGLPGRSASIDYYFADECNQLSIACNTDTKLETTKIMIPMSEFSVHLFKIR